MDIFERIVSASKNTPRGFVDLEGLDSGDAPRVYFTEVSIDDMESVKRKHGEFLGSGNFEAMLEMIIRKCEHEDGSKVFTLEHKVHLRKHLKPLIAAKIYHAIMEGPSVEDHVKN